ncbi:TerC family protein, partial [bacterium]
MHLLEMSLLGTPTWMWAVFITLVLTLLALDLGVLNKGNKEIGVKQSLLLSLFYMTIGVAFGGWIWFQSGQQPAMEYLTGFVIEKSLAMDNIFI